jgi:hypothetical protein
LLLAGVVLAKGTTSLSEETLSFQILLTHRAVEALAVVVVVQRFYPAITCFDRKAASKALGCEQFVPISFAVRVAVFEEEWRIAKQFSTVDAIEAFRMEVLSDGLEAIPFNLSAALGARRSQVLFKAVLTIQLSLFFYEAKVL